MTIAFARQAYQIIAHLGIVVNLGESSIILTMRLTDEERAMLDGAQGEGVRKAMEIVVALGTIYGADNLVPISHVQVSGVSYKNLGDAGLEFLREWAAQGARVRVPTSLNPAGMDLQHWRELGFPPDFAAQQQAVLDAFTAMGIETTCTCTPYLVGYVPKLGDHIAWGESSAVAYANSVLGARTNREGGPGALAAAIAGRTARYGLHLDENRIAQFLIDVRCPVRSESDWAALGYLVGKRVTNGVPYLRGLDATARNATNLKALGAAMAASGAVALYHIEGVTPESMLKYQISNLKGEFAIENLNEGYAALNNSQTNSIDLVWIGCPHASLDEIELIADKLGGRNVRTALWITAAHQVRDEAESRGWLARIEKSGGRIVSDTCLVVAPVEALGFRSMATNSGKGAFYGPSHAHVATHFGSLDQCLEVALSGEWRTHDST
jgi:predicted aconitase